VRLGTAVVFIVSFMTWGIASSAWSQSAKLPLLAKSPVSNSVLMARAIRSGAVKLHASGAPASPSVTVLPNVKASTGSQPVDEDPIAADPSNGQHLETAGNDYNCSSLQGVYNSDNGGSTWRHQCVPVVGAGGCGDPNVAYDLNGVNYFLGIGNCNGSTGSMVIESSANNGVSWNPIHTAFGSLLGGLVDKPWTEADTNSGSPFKNCLYTSWTDFNSSFTQTRASVAHSCDGGGTWTRVAVDSTQTVPKIDQFTDLAIGSGGTVYLTWAYCKTSGSAGDCGNTAADIKFSKSTDGGNTWTSPSVVTTVQMTPDNCGGYYGCFPGSSERLSNIPSIDVNKLDGSLHVAVYTDTGGTARVEETHSTNGGTSWSAPQQVLAFAGNEGWQWLSVSSTGTIGVSFFHSGASNNYLEVGAFSTDGGATWPTKAKISSTVAHFSNDGFSGTFIGDYTGGIWVGGTLHTSWMDARTAPSVDMTGGATP